MELKNDVAVTGTLKSVDQFLNFRIDNMKVVEGDEAKWPHLVSVRHVIAIMLFSRGKFISLTYQ